MRLRVGGEISVPGDKSITHRALMLAAAASGRSRLSGLLAAEDCQSTARVLRELGCAIPPLPPSGAEVSFGSEGLDSWRAPAAPLDCGNSGTTARLLLGLLAGTSLCATLTGDASLRRRPMRRVVEPLSRMGARLTEVEAADRLPVEVCGGALRAMHHRSASASAQVKSALLFAGLAGSVPVSVTEPVRSRDHTERMLRALGVDVREQVHEHGWEVSLYPPPKPLPPLDLHVPGDPSSAAFPIALALLGGGAELCVRGVGTNPTRTGFLRTLARMGAFVELHDERAEVGEPVADLVVRGAELRAVTVEGGEVPAMIDELPVLAILAARAEGETRIQGAAELRVKESDRIAALVENLRGIGVEAEELADGLVVCGSDRPLAGRIVTRGDHRIAMAFGVLAALPENRIQIDTPDVADVSFPGYWALLAALAKRGAGTRR